MRVSDQAELIIGMMSGTSVDGIDIALVKFKNAKTLSVVETAFSPFCNKLRKEISSVALNNSSLRKEDDSHLHDELAHVYAEAVLDFLSKVGIEGSQISAIANHGQTVKHEPDASPAYSLQLGNGQLIANQTGLNTITQFRQADLDAGGQGAPLMPAFHSVFFDGAGDNFILNLGGIANITCLNDVVVGFDTGPSNCLLDQWINKHLDKDFDQNGEWAASGKIVKPVLETLMSDPYLYKAHPKSTGTDYFNLEWLEKNIVDLDSHQPVDIQATLLAFTIESIKLALSQLQATSGQIYVCGGGAQNYFLMSQLQARLNNFEIGKTDTLGVPADWVEAVGFAWLGYCFLHDIPSNLPSVTGASSHLTLGKIFKPTASL